MLLRELVVATRPAQHMDVNANTAAEVGIMLMIAIGGIQ